MDEPLIASDTFYSISKSYNDGHSIDYNHSLFLNLKNWILIGPRTARSKLNPFVGVGSTPPQEALGRIAELIRQGRKWTCRNNFLTSRLTPTRDWPICRRGIGSASMTTAASFDLFFWSAASNYHLHNRPTLLLNSRRALFGTWCVFMCLLWAFYREGRRERHSGIGLF